jgi:hypothetical protein
MAISILASVDACYSPEHKDYDSVNGMIAAVEKRMKKWMSTALLKNFTS